MSLDEGVAASTVVLFRVSCTEKVPVGIHLISERLHTRVCEVLQFDLMGTIFVRSL